MLGPLNVSKETRDELVEHAASGGPVVWGQNGERDIMVERLTEMLQLIVALRDYQFA